jgi:hypothetical protein
MQTKRLACLERPPRKPRSAFACAPPISSDLVGGASCLTLDHHVAHVSAVPALGHGITIGEFLYVSHGSAALEPLANCKGDYQ